MSNETGSHATTVRTSLFMTDYTHEGSTDIYLTRIADYLHDYILNPFRTSPTIQWLYDPQQGDLSLQTFQVDASSVGLAMSRPEFVVLEWDDDQDGVANPSFRQTADTIQISMDYPCTEVFWLDAANKPGALAMLYDGIPFDGKELTSTLYFAYEGRSHKRTPTLDVNKAYAFVNEHRLYLGSGTNARRAIDELKTDSYDYVPVPTTPGYPQRLLYMPGVVNAPNLNQCPFIAPHMEVPETTAPLPRGEIRIVQTDPLPNTIPDKEIQPMNMFDDDDDDDELMFISFDDDDDEIEDEEESGNQQPADMLPPVSQAAQDQPTSIRKIVTARSPLEYGDNQDDRSLARQLSRLSAITHGPNAAGHNPSLSVHESVATQPSTVHHQTDNQYADNANSQTDGLLNQSTPVTDVPSPLQHQHGALLNENQHLQDTVKELKSQRTALEQTVADLQSQQSDLEMRVGAAQQKLDTVKEKMAVTQQQHDNLLKDLELLKNLDEKVARGLEFAPSDTSLDPHSVVPVGLNFHTSEVLDNPAEQVDDPIRALDHNLYGQHIIDIKQLNERCRSLAKGILATLSTTNILAIDSAFAAEIADAISVAQYNAPACRATVSTSWTNIETLERRMSVQPTKVILLNNVFEANVEGILFALTRAKTDLVIILPVDSIISLRYAAQELWNRIWYVNTGHYFKMPASKPLERWYTCSERTLEFKFSGYTLEDVRLAVEQYDDAIAANDLLMPLRIQKYLQGLCVAINDNNTHTSQWVSRQLILLLFNRKSPSAIENVIDSWNLDKYYRQDCYQLLQALTD